MKVILPASEIPDGKLVTKRTGEKVYTLRREIKIYGVQPDEGKMDVQTIKGDGVVFLVSEEGQINAAAHDTELCWRVEDDELFKWLRERVEGTHQ